MTDEQSYEADPKVVATYIGVAMFLGLAVVLLNQARLVALLWAGACLGLGVTVGFLFGIPRTVQADAGTPQAYAQRVNTNLEQISDWLTKILVGLGLTQLSSIPYTLQQAAGYIAEGIGNTPQQRVFAYALIVYFGIVGFIAGYLLTRIFLPRILFLAESGIGNKAVVAQVVTLEQTIATAGGTSPAPSGAAPNDKTRAARAGDMVKATTEILAAYTNLEKKTPAETLRPHIKELEPLKDQFPVFRMLYIVLARLYRWTGDIDRGIDTLSQFLQQKAEDGTSDDKDAAAAFYNRACYYAIKLGTFEAGDPAAADLKRKAINDLKQATSRQREYGAEALRDPDFTSLMNDEEFRNLAA